jgi:hypothetical protein
VSLATGEFIYEKTDLALPDTIPLTFSRTYQNADSHSRSFGIGATDSYDIFMIGDKNPYTYQELVLPNGARVRFDRISSGTSWTDAVYTHVSADDPFYQARISWTTDPTLPGPWKMVLKDGTTMIFPDGSASVDPVCQAVLLIMDRYGNKVTMDRHPARGGTGCVLTRITSPHGRYINVTTDTSEQNSECRRNIIPVRRRKCSSGAFWRHRNRESAERRRR